MRLRYILEELALSSAGVSNDADVDISSQRGPFHGRLGNASKQHQQDAALHLVVACTISDTIQSKIHSFNTLAQSICQALSRADEAAAR